MVVGEVSGYCEKKKNVVSALRAEKWVVSWILFSSVAYLLVELIVSELSVEPCLEL